MIEFDPVHGTLNIADIGFTGGSVVFTFDRFVCRSEELNWGKADNGFGATFADFFLHVSSDGDTVVTSAKNSGSRPARLMDVTIEFYPARMARPPRSEDFLEYIHSVNFETLSGVKRVGLPNRWLKPNPSSSMVYVLCDRKTRGSWIFSTLPPHAGDLVTFRALHDAPHLEGNFGVEIKSVLERVLEPGQSAATSRLQIRAGGDALALLEDLGLKWQRGLNKPPKPPTGGWNSWDYFAEAISSEDILENTRAARELLGLKHPDIVIDDGWEQRWGRWEPSDLFPEGLEKLAADIARLGGVPGIWIAPTAVNAYTRLFRDHEDWFVRDRAGKILEESLGHGQTVYLDVTHPAVQTYIRETFARLRGFGFKIFKVDFTQCATLRGGFCRDGSVPRGGVVRALFEIIREAIGPESYLVTCGAPFETVTGLADSVRVAGDIHNYWSHVLLNVTNISARWWMNKRLWNNDPDFLVVRTAENSPGAPRNRPMNARPFDYAQLWRSGREFNQREAQTYAQLVLVAGADIMAGDHLPALTEAGLNLIRKVLSFRLSDWAVPLDLFESHEGLPSIWLAKEQRQWFVGLFNWEEDAKDIELDLAARGIAPCGKMRSFWDDRAVEAKSGVIQVSLKPRESLGIVIDRA